MSMKHPGRHHARAAQQRRARQSELKAAKKAARLKQYGKPTPKPKTKTEKRKKSEEASAEA